MLNSVNIMGRLTADPKIVVKEEKVNGTFGLAVEVKKDETEFFNVVVYNNKALNLIHKGDKVVLSGRIRARKYTAKDGTNATAFEIVANVIEFAEVKKAESKEVANNSEETPF